MFVYYNTFVTDIPNVDAIALLEPSQVTFIRARNNVMEGTRHAMLKLSPYAGMETPTFSTTSPGPLVEWLGAATRDHSGVPQGDESGTSGPLGHRSSLIRRAGTSRRALEVPHRSDVVVSGINERFAGRGPDIGAIESRH